MRDFACRTAAGVVPSSLATSSVGRSLTTVNQNAFHVGGLNSARIRFSAL